MCMYSPRERESERVGYTVRAANRLGGESRTREKDETVERRGEARGTKERIGKLATGL